MLADKDCYILTQQPSDKVLWPFDHSSVSPWIRFARYCSNTLLEVGEILCVYSNANLLLCLVVSSMHFENQSVFYAEVGKCESTCIWLTF